MQRQEIDENGTQADNTGPNPEGVLSAALQKFKAIVFSPGEEEVADKTLDRLMAETKKIRSRIVRPAPRVIRFPVRALHALAAAACVVVVASAGLLLMGRSSNELLILDVISGENSRFVVRGESEASPEFDVDLVLASVTNAMDPSTVCLERVTSTTAIQSFSAIEEYPEELLAGTKQRYAMVLAHSDSAAGGGYVMALFDTRKNRLLGLRELPEPHSSVELRQAAEQLIELVGP